MDGAGIGKESGKELQAEQNPGSVSAPQPLAWL